MRTIGCTHSPSLSNPPSVAARGGSLTLWAPVRSVISRGAPGCQKRSGVCFRLLVSVSLPPFGLNKLQGAMPPTQGARHFLPTSRRPPCTGAGVGSGDFAQGDVCSTMAWRGGRCCVVERIADGERSRERSPPTWRCCAWENPVVRRQRGQCPSSTGMLTCAGVRSCKSLSGPASTSAPSVSAGGW